MTKTTAIKSRPVFKREAPQPEFTKLTTGLHRPVEELLDILSYRRSADSPGEMAFIAKYLDPLTPAVDGYGNRFVTVGESPVIAFSAHTDTVHRDTPALEKGPKQALIRQELEFHHDGLVVGVKRNQCLGADDGTGIWLMLNMIEAGIPGLYCFFREEESGRCGSEWSAHHESARYEGIKAMMSFDRAGTTDIITHQMGDRCCSEVFAERLGGLIDPSGQMVPDPTGSFTDSASFPDMIGECTNVSVGYNSQHGSHETQDLSFATWLADRLCHINWASLEFEREPGESDGYKLLELLTEYPTECAEALESIGLDVRYLQDEIEAIYGELPTRDTLNDSLQAQYDALFNDYEY